MSQVPLHEISREAWAEAHEERMSELSRARSIASRSRMGAGLLSRIDASIRDQRDLADRAREIHAAKEGE